MATPSKQQCDKAILMISSIEHELLYETARMRTLCAAVKALLPAKAGTHPVFQIEHMKFAEAERLGLFDVRDGIDHSQAIMTMLDGIACSLRSDVSIELEQVRRELGQPSQTLEAA